LQSYLDHLSADQTFRDGNGSLNWSLIHAVRPKTTTLMIPEAWMQLSPAVAIEATAIMAFAVSGLLEAARKKLDPVGVCIVVGLTAFGGGTLRDVLLDRRPFFWVEHSWWLWMLISLSLLSMFFLQTRHFAPTERAVQWPDAVGLGLFTAGGTQLAMAADMPAIVAVLMGTITAVFGGVLRDIVCNEIPQAFRDHRPYAVCSFAGGWVVIAADQFGLSGWIGLVAGATCATALRGLALVFDWRLPQWRAH
jgi:uncharacterized membrane protein YeiH